MTKSRTKVALIVSISLIAVLVIAFVIHSAVSSDETSRAESSISVGYDYPLSSDLQQMIDGAGYIVVGEYTGFDSSWNMARNPDNPKEEDDPENYTEGRLYNFTVERTLKGSIDDQSILVNHKYSETIWTTESDAVMDAEGNIVKPATETKDISFTVVSPMFIEPEYGCKYILFLCRGGDFGYYYASGEPFSIKITDGVAALQSNLLDRTGDFTQEFESDSKKYSVIIDYGGITFNDEITGLSTDEIIQKIEDGLQQ